MIYNEIDPFACDWLANLVAAGEIPSGTIDRRSIKELAGDDCHATTHFFAGIGGWPLALRLAGWPDDRPIWTGSCPCQPFSQAGKRKGTDDDRHLWPEMLRLVGQCRPPIIVGEQVASKDGLGWLDGVFADLEGSGYSCGAVDLCAAGVGAPHIRQRLYWVAIAASCGCQLAESIKAEVERPPQGHGDARKLPSRLEGYAGDIERLEHAARHRRKQGRAEPDGRHADAARDADGLGNATEARRTGRQVAGESRSDESERLRRGEPERAMQPDGLGNAGSPRRTLGARHARDDGSPDKSTGRQTAEQTGPWSEYRIIPCADGKQRRISAEPGDEPLAYGVPVKVGQLFARMVELGHSAKDARRIIREARRNRVVQLRGYGNAIVPHVAVEFLRTVMAAIDERTNP